MGVVGWVAACTPWSLGKGLISTGERRRRAVLGLERWQDTKLCAWARDLCKLGRQELFGAGG